MLGVGEFAFELFKGKWWVDKMRDMDSLQITVAAWDGGMTKKPSDYCKQSVFLGASFQSRIEAEDALDNDYMSQIIWGTDYPHTEGGRIVLGPAVGEGRVSVLVRNVRDARRPDRSLRRGAGAGSADARSRTCARRST